MNSLLLLLILTLAIEAKSIYFVAPKGNDINTGSIKKPFKTLKKAIEMSGAGDTVNIRAGVYPLHNKFPISGKEGQPITFQAYRGEKVVFKGPYGEDKVYDLNRNTANGSFIITGDWLVFKNLELTNGTNGIHLKSNASHNHFENLSLHDNYYTGLVMTDGASDNLVLNCDSYHNFDSNSHGQHADGFVVVGHKRDTTPYIGKGNRFINCRSWGNSDDGFDCWQGGNPVTFINCLSYKNGYDLWHKGTFKGDGNGFKLGVHNRYGHAQDAHLLIGCKAWKNNSRGFDYNDNEVAITLFRNFSWKNRNSGYKFGRTNHNLIQNINLESGRNYLSHDIYEEGNSWNKQTYNIKNDIVSFDDHTIKSKRDANGEITTNGFLELKKGSLFFDPKSNIKYQRLIELKNHLFYIVPER